MVSVKSMGDLRESMVLMEVIGSKFLHSGLFTEVRTFFELCKEYYEINGTKIRIDVKYCKIAPDVGNLFIEYVNDIEFFDSSDILINSILEHNSTVQRHKDLIELGIVSYVDIPENLTLQEILLFMKGLEKGKIYRIQSSRELNNKPPYISVWLAIAIVGTRPDISVDITEGAQKFFDLFKTVWSYSGCCPRESYNMLWGGNILRIDKETENDLGVNMYRVPNFGLVTENELNTQFEVIPYCFGRMSIEELKTDLELKDVCNHAMQTIAANIKQKARSKRATLADTIGG